jgi:hypothetical protein
MQINKRKILWTAAAALSSNTLSFTTPQQGVAHAFVHPAFVGSPPPASSMTRLYHASAKKEEGFLEKVKDAAKSILPKKWFQSDKERKAELARRQVQDEISGGLKEILKDAPFPIRVLGGLMGKAMSSAMSSIAETMAETQQQIDSLMLDANRYLLSDDAVAQALGVPIQVGSPFSQSSSTSGKTISRIELGFPVSGSRGSGVARLVSSGEGIQELSLQVGGRVIQVSLSGKSRRQSFSSGGDDNIIEAEIVEKKPK